MNIAMTALALWAHNVRPYGCSSFSLRQRPAAGKSQKKAERNDFVRTCAAIRSCIPGAHLV